MWLMWIPLSILPCHHSEKVSVIKQSLEGQRNHSILDLSMSLLRFNITTKEISVNYSDCSPATASEWRDARWSVQSTSQHTLIPETADLSTNPARRTWQSGTIRYPGQETTEPMVSPRDAMLQCNCIPTAKAELCVPVEIILQWSKSETKFLRHKVMNWGSIFSLPRVNYELLWHWQC